MTKKQLVNYLRIGDELEFEYEGKKYAICPYGMQGEPDTISFYEFYKEGNNYPSANDFLEKANINGKKLVDILYDIDDVEVY